MRKIALTILTSALSLSVFANTQFNFIQIPSSASITPYDAGSVDFGGDGSSETTDPGTEPSGNVSKIVITTSGGGGSWVDFEYLAALEFFEGGSVTPYDTGTQITSETLEYETDKMVLSVSDHWQNGTYYYPENMLKNPNVPDGSGLWAEIWASLDSNPSVITVEFKNAINLSDVKFSPNPAPGYGQPSLSFDIDVYDGTGALSKTIIVNPTNETLTAAKVYNLNISTEAFTELAETVEF